MVHVASATVRHWLRAALIFTVAAIGAGYATSAVAQDELRARETYRDWSVFVDDQAPETYCYIAAVPTSWEAFRDGQRLETVRRGAPYLFVSTFPSAGVTNEISVKLGYTADTTKDITLTIGSQTFQLFAEGEEAWLATPEQDAAVIQAMRAGATAIITATSSRGTRVVDEYSLLGFTASIEAVGRACP